MSAQTTYVRNMPVAYAGLIADLEPAEIISKVAEGSAIGFGKTVSRGTSDDQATLGGTALIGITVRSLDREGAASTGAIDYDDESTMAVVRKGYIWAVITETGVPGNQLNSVNATGAIGVGAAVAGETDMVGATLESTVVSAGDLGIVRVDF
jgi:hypothetical protein